MDGRRRGRPSMDTVVAVKIDRSREVTDCLGETKHLLSRNAVVSERDVDVPQPVLAGTLNLRLYTVYGDHGLDAKLLERCKTSFTVGAAATKELVRNSEYVMEAASVDLGWFR